MGSKRFKSSKIQSSSHIWELELDFEYCHSKYTKIPSEEDFGERSTLKCKNSPDSCPLRWDFYVVLTNPCYDIFGVRTLPGFLTIGLRRADYYHRDAKASLLYVIRNKLHHVYDMKRHEVTFTYEYKEYKFPLLLRPTKEFFCADEDLIRIDLKIEVENCCFNANLEKVLEDCKSHTQFEFKSLLRDFSSADVFLKVEDEKLPAHMCILSVRCPKFYEMCQELLLKDAVNHTVNITGVEKPILKAFLSFTYTGFLDVTRYQSVMELYTYAAQFNFETLLETCRAFIISHTNPNTVPDLLKFAEKQNDNVLKNIAQGWIDETYSYRNEQRTDSGATHSQLAGSVSESVPSNI